LRHLSRRVVRVEIGQKPGVVRGTGSSNPSPSSGESRANLTSWIRKPRFFSQQQVAGSLMAALRERDIEDREERGEPSGQIATEITQRRGPAQEIVAN
jgi:hypothetical protein